MDTKNISFILHHMNEDDLPLHAVSPPIFQTSNFCFQDFDEFKEAISDEIHHSLYTRGRNPTVSLVEEKLAALEGGERAKLLSAGVAAICHSIMAFVKSGDHVVCIDDCYSWVRKLLSSYLPRFNVSVTYVEGTDPDEVIAAIKPETRVMYLESPTSLTFKLQNVPVIAAEARKRNIKTIIDNTWATPIFCNPLSMGIDLVVHSGSKYFGGSSDLVAGVLVGSTEDVERIERQEFLQLGTVPDPFMAWLMLRGLRTLHIRMKTHYESTLKAASFLEKHPKVASVTYPFLDSFTQIDLARRLFRGGSGLFRINLKTKKVREVAGFINSLRLFKRAVRWGGYESLVFANVLSYPDPKDAPADRLNLVRFHIGLETPEDLIEDLDNALTKNIQ
jgi:cystathionine beta-lyase